jgi:hypothetical protein
MVLFGFKNYYFNRCRLQRLKFFTAVADIVKKFLTPSPTAVQNFKRCRGQRLTFLSAVAYRTLSVRELLKVKEQKFIRTCRY